MPSSKVIVLVVVFGAVSTVTVGAAAPDGVVGVGGDAVSMEGQSWETSNETTSVETTTTTGDTDPAVDDDSVNTTTVSTESAVDESVSNTSSDTTSGGTEPTANATKSTDATDTATTTDTADTTSTNTTEALETGTIEESTQTSDRTSTDTSSDGHEPTADSSDSPVDTATQTRNDSLDTARGVTAGTLTTATEVAGDAKRTVEDLADESLTEVGDVSTEDLLDEDEVTLVVRTTISSQVVDIGAGAGDGSSGVEEATVGASGARSGMGIDAVQRASDQDAGSGGVNPGTERGPKRSPGRAVSRGLSEPGSDRSEIPFSGRGGPQFRPTATAALTMLALGFACTGAAGLVSPVSAWGALTRRATGSIGQSIRGSGVDRFVPLPGYSRYDDSDPLENERRREIYETVAESPGVHRARLAEQAGVSPATVRYHARVLERERLVKSEKIGGRQRLYPLGFDDVELAAALEDDATAGVVAAIVDEGPVQVSELAASVGRCPGTISHHLDRLEDADLIEREERGNTVQVRATPAVHAAVTAERDRARQ